MRFKFLEQEPFDRQILVIIGSVFTRFEGIVILMHPTGEDAESETKVLDARGS